MLPDGQDVAGPPRSRLRADCSRCFALCCVGLPFTRSADFAVDKAAGEPCRHLLADLGCGIHRDLREQGFAGCVAYDCFGAGQRVSMQTFDGRDWRTGGEPAGQMFAALPVVRQLHEMLWYLEELREHPACAQLAADVERLLAATEAIAGLPVGALLAADLPAHRSVVGPLLIQASATIRGQVRADPPERAGADLSGADLRTADLRAACLRSATMIGTSLQGIRLDHVDLLGADLRNADVCGADLSTAIFLTQSQVGSAIGDVRTALPAALARPAHWGDAQ